MFPYDLPESLLFYAIAIPAVFLLGLAKGGFAGIGMVAMPMIVLVTPPVQAASIVLPILIVQDAVSVWAFRHNWNGRILAVMLPGAIIGIVLGYMLAAMVSSDAVEFAVGATSVIFAVWRLWVDQRKLRETGPMPSWIGTVCGVASGFTSQIAHAGAPPFQIYVMPKRLSPPMLVGTTAIYFATVNWLKVPAYMALGQFTRQNMLISATLLPVAVISTWIGVLLIRRISPERLYTIIYILMILVGLRLCWTGAQGLV